MLNILNKIPAIFLIIFLACGLRAGTAYDENKIAGISFTAPENWNETQPTSSMRAFQFAIPGAVPHDDAEMAVFYFGRGMGGGVQANIDRWKGQFTVLRQDKTEERQVNGLEVVVVTLKGTYQPTGGPMMAAQGPPVEDFAVLGAIAAAPEGPVFFKMTGPEKTIDNAREDFNRLINSIR